MLRFFDSNYTLVQLQELRILINDSLIRLQQESECEIRYVANECDVCPYRELCSDLYRLEKYLNKLETSGKIGKKGGDK